MKFSYFYESRKEEDNTDLLKGLCALALADLIAYGSIDADRVEQLRLEATNDGLHQMVDADLSDNPFVNSLTAVDATDTIKVTVSHELGKRYETCFTTPKLSAMTNKRLKSLYEHLEQSTVAKHIKKEIKTLLTNKKPDDVVFHVSALDNKKAITVQVEANTSDATAMQVMPPLSYVVLAGNDTPDIPVPNIFDALFQLAKLFKCPCVKGIENLESFPTLGPQWLDKVKEEVDVKKELDNSGSFVSLVKAYDTAQQHHKRMKRSDVPEQISQKSEREEAQSLETLYTAILDSFKDLSQDDKTISHAAFEFLQMFIFDEELRNVISITDTGIDEIEYDVLQKLRTSHTLGVQVEPTFLAFVDTATDDILVKVKPVFPTDENGIEKNIFIELGDAFKS